MLAGHSAREIQQLASHSALKTAHAGNTVANLDHSGNILSIDGGLHGVELDAQDVGYGVGVDSAIWRNLGRLVGIGQLLFASSALENTTRILKLGLNRCVAAFTTRVEDDASDD